MGGNEINQRQTQMLAETAVGASAFSDAWVGATKGLEHACAAQREAGVKQKEAKKALRTYEPALRKAQAKLNAARTNLDRFCEGPMAAYQDLVKSGASRYGCGGA